MSVLIRLTKSLSICRGMLLRRVKYEVKRRGLGCKSLCAYLSDIRGDICLHSSLVHLSSTDHSLAPGLRAASVRETDPKHCQITGSCLIEHIKLLHHCQASVYSLILLQSVFKKALKLTK